MSEIYSDRCRKEKIYVEQKKNSISKSDDTALLWQNLADVLADIIARHIDEIDMSSLPTYAVLKYHDQIREYYEKYLILRMQQGSSSDEDDSDFTVFDENDQYQLNNVG